MERALLVLGQLLGTWIGGELMRLLLRLELAGLMMFSHSPKMVRSKTFKMDLLGWKRGRASMRSNAELRYPLTMGALRRLGHGMR
jgi:hypothetical protein